MKTLRIACFALCAVTLATPALAEVSDKIPTFQNLWTTAIGLNVIALLLGLWRPTIALIIWPFGAFLAFGQYDMVTTDIASAILHEQGQGYIDAAHRTAAILALGPPTLYVLTYWLRERWLGRKREDLTQ